MYCEKTAYLAKKGWIPHLYNWKLGCTKNIPQLSNHLLSKPNYSWKTIWYRQLGFWSKLINKQVFSLCMDNVSSLKIPFLISQTDQNKQEPSCLWILFSFLPTQKPFQPKRPSQTYLKSLMKSEKERKEASTIALQWKRRWSTVSLHAWHR